VRAADRDVDDREVAGVPEHSLDEEKRCRKIKKFIFYRQYTYM